MNEMLYKECVRYGEVISDKEFKTDKGEYIRHITYKLDDNKMFFSLMNGEIIYFRLDK